MYCKEGCSKVLLMNYQGSLWQFEGFPWHNHWQSHFMHICSLCTAFPFWWSNGTLFLTIANAGWWWICQRCVPLCREQGYTQVFQRNFWLVMENWNFYTVWKSSCCRSMKDFPVLHIMVIFFWARMLQWSRTIILDENHGLQAVMYIGSENIALGCLCFA